MVVTIKQPNSEVSLEKDVKGKFSLHDAHGKMV